MAILLTNDDGIDAPGMRALVEALSGLDRLYVAAPATNQSAMGMAITTQRKLVAKVHPKQPGVAARHSLDGTPTDSVMYGLRHLLKGKPPRLVVSGINLGANIGQNIMCSGTVAAAFTALLAGVPAVATSLGYTDRAIWDGAKHYTRVVVEKALELIEQGDGKPFLLNLNVPALPPERIRGLAVTRHGMGGFQDGLGLNPDGETYSHVGDWIQTPLPPVGDCDGAAFLADYAVVTPMRFEMTDGELLEHLQRTWN